MTDDLHARLTAALRVRLEVARAATPGPWQHVDYADPEGQPLASDGSPSTFMGCGSVITMAERVMGGDIAMPHQPYVAGPAGDCYPRGGYSPKEDMTFIAANDPATEIRRVEALLRAGDTVATLAWALENRMAVDVVATLAKVIRDLAAGEGIEP